MKLLRHLASYTPYYHMWNEKTRKVLKLTIIIATIWGIPEQMAWKHFENAKKQTTSETTQDL